MQREAAHDILAFLVGGVGERRKRDVERQHRVRQRADDPVEIAFVAVHEELQEIQARQRELSEATLQSWVRRIEPLETLAARD